MNYFATLGLTLFAYMSMWFVVSLFKKRNDVADVAWGLGFTLMAWTSLLLSGNFVTRGLLVSILVSVWGLRLAWHIHARNKGRGEDYRYAAWRAGWGRWFYVRSYLQVYVLQAVLLFAISLPVLVINHMSKSPLGWLDVLGVAVWLVGFYFEAVGDAQLGRFIKDPANKGKLMTHGLWQYTRHPNYFGEVTQWWGVWLLALSVPFGGWTVVGPLTITVLILFVSGVPMLEKKMVQHPAFVTYKKSTSMFFPWFKKRVAAE